MPPCSRQQAPEADAEADVGSHRDDHSWPQVTVRLAVLLAVLTVLAWAVPADAAAAWLFKDLLLLAAFALPLVPLWRASRVVQGSENIAWSLLLLGCASGLAGQAAWLFYRLTTGQPEQSVLPEVGFAAWIALTAVALALEVSSGGREVRAELVVDLLLIGGIGLVLAREIFAYVAPPAVGPGPLEVVLGGANVIASLALAVTALGVLMSPSALGGGVPRLLITLGGFAVAVSRMVFAYRLFRGASTPWLAPAWSFALLLIAVAGVERLLVDRAETPVAERTSLLRTLVVPVIVAYAMSLLVRELLSSGEAGGPEGMAWAMLALLIVTRVGVAIFVSERQTHELSAWERRHETVVNALGEVVYEWDPATDRVLRSGNAEQVFGVGLDKLEDNLRETLDRIHPDDRAEAEDRLHAALEHGGWFEAEYRLRQPAGDWRRIRDRGLCLPAEGNRPGRVLGLMADVTEARDAEERLNRAERLAALGGLAAGAAHEINNPLAAIHLAAQMLQEDPRLAEGLRDDVQIIARQAQRAADVTDRMLVFARKKEGERTSVDLRALIEDLLRSRRYELETHGIRLQEQLSRDLRPVWADPGQLERALLNLIVNAEHALTEVPEGERCLSVKAMADGDGARVEVIDNGPGIPAEILPRIFDPFFTTRNVGEGTGLGLSMSYSIVQAHGGDLSVETRQGQTVFTLEFPPLDQERPALGATREQEPATSGDEGDEDVPGPPPAVEDRVTRAAPPESPGRRAAGVLAGRRRSPVASTPPGESDGKPSADAMAVLVVDDESSVRRLARRFLEQHGHRVDEAANGKAALEFLSEKDYDSIILDLRMPDLSGEGLYEWLKKHRPLLASRVTVISGDFANPETGEILDRIGQPFLLKPFDLRELLALVER